jgi:hypothetical protein
LRPNREYKLAGIKVGSAWETMLEHITGLGHLEIFKLAAYSKYDSKSSKAAFERAVTALNNKLVSTHSTQQRLILNKNTLAEQQAAIKGYAKAVTGEVDKFKRDWKVDELPKELQAAYNAAERLER